MTSALLLAEIRGVSEKLNELLTKAHRRKIPVTVMVSTAGARMGSTREGKTQVTVQVDLTREK